MSAASVMEVTGVRRTRSRVESLERRPQINRVTRVTSEMPGRGLILSDRGTQGRYQGNMPMRTARLGKWDAGL